MPSNENVHRFDGAFDRSLFAGASCAFGVFDGVHKGHRFIIESARAHGARQGVPSVVITFDRDPDEVFAKEGFRKLMDDERRIAALAATGVDHVVVLPFGRALASLEPLAFLERTFAQDPPGSLHVGRDLRFGAGARGDVGTLRFWGERTGTEVLAYELETFDDEPITSTRIRRLLADPGEGRLEEANALLTQPFSVVGTIERGRGDGREFGIRTANMVVDELLLPLAEGVYASEALVDGVRYRAAVNVGVALTFEDATTANVEAHLLDFDQEIYGQRLELRFHQFLRPMRRFASTEELIATITADIARTRTIPL